MSNSGALAGWLRILEEPSPGDTEWEQAVLCGGVSVWNTILEHEEEDKEEEDVAQS